MHETAQTVAHCRPGDFKSFGKPGSITIASQPETAERGLLTSMVTLLFLCPRMPLEPEFRFGQSPKP